MKILVARIPEEGSRYEDEESSSILQMEADRFASVKSAVRYSLYAQHLSSDLVVRGALSVDVELRCSRCSEFFSTTVTDSDFLRVYPISTDTDFVDITEDMREDLLLNIPSFPVCGEECKGLCVQCGAVLGKDRCGCEAGEGSSVWHALDNLNL
jgi:uncharacterized protein